MFCLRMMGIMFLAKVNQNTLDTKTDDTRLCNLRLQTGSSDNCRYGADVYGQFELPLCLHLVHLINAVGQVCLVSRNRSRKRHRHVM